MKTPLDIAIVGPGKVGTAIGIRAGRAGWRVVAVGGRDIVKARSAAEAIGPAVPAGPMIDADRSEILRRWGVAQELPGDGG